MGTISRRLFRPVLDGYRLEVRVVLNAASTIQSAAAAPVVEGPPVAPPFHMFRASFVVGTLNQINTSFQTFLKNYNKAVQTAINGLNNGLNQANLIASLKANIALQGGLLQASLDRVASRLPGGEMYLFDPAQGKDPNGYPTPAKPCGKDIRYYVRPELRLKTQVATLLATLDQNANSIQQAGSQDSILAIVNTGVQSKSAAKQYVKCAVTMSDFAVKGWG